MPEALLSGVIERVMRPNIISDEQFQKSMEVIFTKYAPVFEALAESERNDGLAGR